MGIIGLTAMECNGTITTSGHESQNLSTPQPVIARLEMRCILQGIDDFTFNPPEAVLKGDVNCDTVVDIQDVELFVLALIDAPAYKAAFPTCHIRRADMNCDRKEDGLDVQGFTDALLGL